MNKILSIILSLIFGSSPLLQFSEIPLEIPNNESPIMFWEGKKISLRGFWYPLKDHAGVLTNVPQLKSCCVLAPSKITQQVFVKGELSSLRAHSAVTVEGIFKIDPLYNQNGELIQLYILEDAKEISSSHFSLIWTLFGIASYAIFLFLTYI